MEEGDHRPHTSETNKKGDKEGEKIRVGEKKKRRRRVETSKKLQEVGTYVVLPGSHPNPFGNEIHVHLWMRDFCHSRWWLVGSWLPKKQE